MAHMGVTRAVDPSPILRLLADRDGECSFEDALGTLKQQGLSDNDSRDALWQLLSQGTIEFTSERRLRLPQHSASEKAAG